MPVINTVHTATSSKACCIRNLRKLDVILILPRTAAENLLRVLLPLHRLPNFGELLVFFRRLEASRHQDFVWGSLLTVSLLLVSGRFSLGATHSSSIIRSATIDRCIAVLLRSRLPLLDANVHVLEHVAGALAPVHGLVGCYYGIGTSIVCS